MWSGFRTSPTSYTVNNKEYTYKKYKSERDKIINATQQVVFYSIIDGDGKLNQSKKTKSINLTYENCVKKLKA